MTRALVRVRPAVVDDVGGVVALVRLVDAGPGGAGVLAAMDGRGADAAGPDGPDAQLASRVRQAIDDPERSVLVAADDTGEPAGVLLARHDDVGSVSLTPVLHVTHLMVLPDHRRRGTGRALLAAAVHLAEEAGAEHVLATAAAGSREANRYLARIGFAPLVLHRIAPTSVLRRSLGLHDQPGRLAALRRARLVRARRGAAPRAVGHGA